MFVELQPIAKILIFIGVLFVISGILLFILSKGFPGWKMPLDFKIKKGNLTIYIPLGTSILLSILLTLFFSIFRK